MTAEDDVLSEQIAYYRARAPEYDEWFRREGLCDLGPGWNERWHDEVESVARVLDDFAPRGRVLEIACGTGWWTERLARHTGRLTAVDSSPEAMELARERVPDAEYVVANIFEWEPDETYDVVFFSFWLSHVPARRFASFWELVGRALAPDGRVFFIDNLRREIPRGSTQRDGDREGEVTRRLNDGREFRAVKLYYEPDDLSRRLAELGWNVDVRSTEWFLYYGRGRRG